MMPEVTLESVTKSYLMGRVEVFALRGIDLEIRRGAILAISGPSGSGKSTLLNIMGGIDRPTAGNVVVAGKYVARLEGRELDEYRRDTVGFIFQFFNLVPTLTALQNVELPLTINPLATDIEGRAQELLSSVGLSERTRHLPQELSGGEQQRVAIAVALANDPPLLLADEPTGELDSQTGERVISVLLETCRKLGKTAVIASHDSGVLSRCDYLLSLHDGKILD